MFVKQGHGVSWISPYQIFVAIIFIGFYIEKSCAPQFYFRQHKVLNLAHGITFQMHENTLSVRSIYFFIIIQCRYLYLNNAWFSNVSFFHWLILFHKLLSYIYLATTYIIFIRYELFTLILQKNWFNFNLMFCRPCSQR